MGYPDDFVIPVSATRRATRAARLSSPHAAGSSPSSARDLEQAQRWERLVGVV